MCIIKARGGFYRAIRTDPWLRSCIYVDQATSSFHWLGGYSAKPPLNFLIHRWPLIWSAPIIRLSTRLGQKLRIPSLQNRFLISPKPLQYCCQCVGSTTKVSRIEEHFCLESMHDVMLPSTLPPAEVFAPNLRAFASSWSTVLEGHCTTTSGQASRSCRPRWWAVPGRSEGACCTFMPRRSSTGTSSHSSRVTTLGFSSMSGANWRCPVAMEAKKNSLLNTLV